jgi:energy-coupling factor transport system permease protein
MIIYVGSFVVFNIFMTYFFAPEYGVELYGTRHELIRFFGSYSITLEQLLYQGTKVMKYIAVVPFGIIFFLTTNPSELSASLNKIGIPYKFSYPLSLTLRYFPDVQRNYRDISLAQQARGLELSKKANLKSRFKNAVLIIIPLIFSTIERVDVISNAMDLRGFGKTKKRTWYSLKAMDRGDILALLISSLIFITSIGLAVFVNGGRFYNPFV